MENQNEIHQIDDSTMKELAAIVENHNREIRDQEINGLRKQLDDLNKTLLMKVKTLKVREASHQILIIKHNQVERQCKSQVGAVNNQFDQLKSIRDDSEKKTQTFKMHLRQAMERWGEKEEKFDKEIEDLTAYIDNLHSTMERNGISSDQLIEESDEYESDETFEVDWSEYLNRPDEYDSDTQFEDEDGDDDDCDDDFDMPRPQSQQTASSEIPQPQARRPDLSDVPRAPTRRADSSEFRPPSQRQDSSDIPRPPTRRADSSEFRPLTQRSDSSDVPRPPTRRADSSEFRPPSQRSDSSDVPRPPTRRADSSEFRPPNQRSDSSDIPRPQTRRSDSSDIPRPPTRRADSSCLHQNMQHQQSLPLSEEYGDEESYEEDCKSSVVHKDVHLEELQCSEPRELDSFDLIQEDGQCFETSQDADQAPHHEDVQYYGFIQGIQCIQAPVETVLESTSSATGPQESNPCDMVSSDDSGFDQQSHSTELVHNDLSTCETTCNNEVEQSQPASLESNVEAREIVSKKPIEALPFNMDPFVHGYIEESLREKPKPMQKPRLKKSKSKPKFSNLVSFGGY